jgi:DNA-binding NarL/FixJ family response regulator
MIKIIIVEDNDVLRETWSTIINEQKNMVCVASFSTQIDAIKNIPLLPVDIVLMDLHLKPSGLGVECIRQLHPKCPMTQFLVFTIFEDEDSIFDALTAGANGYIIKNSPIPKVIAAIEELYEGGAPMSAVIAKKILKSYWNKTPLREEFNLFPREHEILMLLNNGYLYKEIADQLDLSTGTVKQYIHAIYKKLHVQNKTEALNKYFSHHAHA